MSFVDVIGLVGAVLGIVVGVIDIYKLRVEMRERRSGGAGAPQQDASTAPSRSATDRQHRMDPDGRHGDGSAAALRGTVVSYVLSRVLLWLSAMWLLISSNALVVAMRSGDRDDFVGLGLRLGDLPDVPVAVHVFLAVVNMAWSGASWRYFQRQVAELDQQIGRATARLTAAAKLSLSRSEGVDVHESLRVDEELRGLQRRRRQLWLPMVVYGVGCVMVAGSLALAIFGRAT